MTAFSWLWLVGFAGFFVITETAALIVKDKPGKPATLSANIWWVIQGAGPWHHIARVAVLCGLAWLSVHLLTGGWM